MYFNEIEGMNIDILIEEESSSVFETSFWDNVNENRS
jgi:hypothetical protein